MPPAQKPTGVEGAARALPREQPVAADAATPTPVNNESAGAEGAEFIAQDLSQDPPGNDDLLLSAAFSAPADLSLSEKMTSASSTSEGALPFRSPISHNNRAFAFGLFGWLCCTSSVSRPPSPW